MRGRVILLMAMLVLPLLAGCVSDDEVTNEAPRSPESEASERTFIAAEAAARKAAGGELVAAFSVVASRPGQLESVSSDFPGIGALAGKMVENAAAVPGDGELTKWAFLYEESAGADTLQSVLVEEDDGDDFQLTQDSVDRNELLLLRVERAMDSLPGIPPADALEAALEDEQWKSKTSRGGIFLMYILQADSRGDPEWRLIISESDPLAGQSIVIGGGSGTVKDPAEPWPERLLKETEVRGQDDVNTQIPGDEMNFTITVDAEDHPVLHVLPTRTGTGAIIGDPSVELESPDGSSKEINYDAWHLEESPASGDWTVLYTWELPDVYRSIRVVSCLQPIPFLFAERVDQCEPEEE